MLVSIDSLKKQQLQGVPMSFVVCVFAPYLSVLLSTANWLHDILTPLFQHTIHLQTIWLLHSRHEQTRGLEAGPQMPPSCI